MILKDWVEFNYFKNHFENTKQNKKISYHLNSVMLKFAVIIRK